MALTLKIANAPATARTLVRRKAAATVLSEHRAALLSLLLIAALYVGALALLPPQALTHHDEGAKYLQVRNLRITKSGLDWSINYPARHLDPGLEFVPFHPKQHYIDSQGRIYLQWPIFLGLLTRVFWKVLGFWGLYVVPLLAGLGTLWASYRLALAVGLPNRLAWLAVPLVGLATPIPIYSMLYFEHTLASLLVTLSMLTAVRAVTGKGSVGESAGHEGQAAPRAKGIESIPARWLAPDQRLAITSGFLLALAIYFRSELYVLAVVLFGGLLIAGARCGAGWRLPAAWIGAFGIALVPLWAFYAVTEGTLLPTHALWYFTGSDPSGGAPTEGGIPALGLPPLRYIATAGWGVVPAFLLGPQTAPLAPRYSAWVEWAAIVGAMLCAASGLLAVAKTRLAALRVPLLVVGLVPVLVSTMAVLFSSQQYYNLHGFLLASPFIVLALWPGATDLRGRFLFGVGLLYVGLHALIISALSGLGPISLHEWGQRYLLPAYPMLVVLSLLSVADITRAWHKKLMPVGWIVPALYFLLALTGLGFAARGYLMLRQERIQVVDWLNLVRTLPQSEPVVTDVWWLPLNLAADFYSRPFMLAQGDARLSLWAEKMRSRGVTSFGLATTNASALTGGWTRSVPGLRANGPPRETEGLWLQGYTFSSGP